MRALTTLTTRCNRCGVWVMTRYKCEVCGNEGYIYSTNEQGQDEVQRCDECAVYQSDAEAQQAEALAIGVKEKL